jgi:hypothetical protein
VATTRTEDGQVVKREGIPDASPVLGSHPGGVKMAASLIDLINYANIDVIYIIKFRLRNKYANEVDRSN